MDDENLMSFRIDNETKRKLEAIAKEQDRTMSATIRVLISAKYEELFVAIPLVGTISEAGIKIEEKEK